RSSLVFLLTSTCPAETYTLSLHDALPILVVQQPDIEIAIQKAQRQAEEARQKLEGIHLEGADLQQLKALSAVDASVFAELAGERSEEHTSELQSRSDLVCRLLLEKKKTT